MECNVGGNDRAIRLVSGATAITLALFGPLGRTGRIVALGLGTMELLTALTRYCPLNQALGINTCREAPLEAVKDALDDARELAA